MASFFTNRGFYMVLGWAFRADTMPTYLYVALITSATAPTVDTNTFSEVTEINTGNGYAAGGYQLTPGATDFDQHVEDDGDNYAYVQIKDVVWNASGGSIPNGGSGARYGILTDDNATQANRQIIYVIDLTTDRSVSDGQSLTLQNIEMQIRQAVP